MPSISNSMEQHPIAIAIQQNHPHHNSVGKRTSFEDLFDTHESISSLNSSGISFSTSPIRKSPLHS